MAVTAETLTEEPGTFRCGHPRTSDNEAWYRHSRTGVVYARCQQCKREAVRRSRHKNSPAPTRSMLMPRPGRGGQAVVVSDQTYATSRLFQLIPHDLRNKLAGIIFDDRVDLLQRRVLERCADRRAWSGMDESSATRLYAEAIIDAVLDARSPLLRCDRILGLAFG